MASTSERPAVAATLVRPPAIAGPRTTHPLAYVMGEIDLVRALRLGDIPTVVVAGRRSPSRYARGPVAVLEPPDVKRAPEAAVDRLLGYAAGQAEPPVVFYDNDPALMLVSRARDRLRERLRFLMPAAELVEDLVDKGRFQALAEQLGLPVPRAVRMTSHDVRLDHGLRYPRIVKPLTRHDGPWESLEAGKAVPIADARALTGIGERLQGTDLQLLVQESVPGAEDRIESYHVYVDERGAVAGEFTGRKVRTAPTAYGYSTAVTITDSPPV